MVGIGVEIGAPGEPSHPEGERDWGGLCAMALETYTRHPAGKHRILDVMADKGVPLPDSPAMAVHRGRVDLLERHLGRDANILNRTLSIDDIYPWHWAVTKTATSPSTVRPSTAQRFSTWRSSMRMLTWRAG